MTRSSDNNESPDSDNGYVRPPITAYRLHKRLPNSKLAIVEQAGHVLWEGGPYKSFLQAVAEFE